MALLFYSKADDPEAWRTALHRIDPALDMRVWPDVGAHEQIEAALVWHPPLGDLARYPNLKLIQSLGAGVDHIAADTTLPSAVPVARLVDHDLTRQMVEYVILAVLNRHRRIDDYRDLQAKREWRVLPMVRQHESRVGILGLGEISGAAASVLLGLGFPVSAWTRTRRQAGQIAVYHGPDGLTDMLQNTDILICLLPLTPETRGLLNAERFAQLPAGAYVINAGRGPQLIEPDLLAALDSGHLSGAWLDVFAEEPLPADHPLWNHPKVMITPHIAGLTNPQTAAQQVIDNLRRVQAGEPPRHLVDLARGY